MINNALLQIKTNEANDTSKKNHAYNEQTNFIKL